MFFSVLVILLASVERFGVSRMRDFFLSNIVLVICLAPVGALVYNLITDKYLAVAPDFPFSKRVCKSQNGKCVCKSHDIIQNVSVSHKFGKCVCRSQNSHIQRSFVNGLQWFQLVTGGLHVKNHHGTCSSTKNRYKRIL